MIISSNQTSWFIQARWYYLLYWIRNLPSSLICRVSILSGLLWLGYTYSKIAPPVGSSSTSNLTASWCILSPWAWSTASFSGGKSSRLILKFRYSLMMAMGVVCIASLISQLLNAFHQERKVDNQDEKEIESGMIYYRQQRGNISSSYQSQRV